MLITFNNIRTLPSAPSFQRRKIKEKPVHDVYERTASSDLLSLPRKNIFELIKKSISDINNLLGQGGEAAVWKIEKSNYCVRLPLHSSGNITDRFSSKLTAEDRVNHTLAKLGSGATIMPIIEGYTFCSSSATNQEVAKMVEDMPVKAFEDLFLQIYKAEQLDDISFDTGLKNIIINPDKNTLTAIDFYITEDGIFKNQIFTSIFDTIANPALSSPEQRKICAGKLILAALSINKKYPEVRPFESDFSGFMNRVCWSELIDNVKYKKVILDNVNQLPDPFAEKTLKALVKQLFGVVSDS